MLLIPEIQQHKAGWNGYHIPNYCTALCANQHEKDWVCKVRQCCALLINSASTITAHF